ncbi:MAG: hypothetical protein ACYCQJ_02590 [Nitrososphaerales archaeon]
MSTPPYWPSSVQEKINRLKRGDSISVVWIDASQSHTRIRPSLTNNYVETKCESQGTFLAIQTGNLYLDPFLVLLKNKIDDYVLIESIPLVLVKDIDIFSKKQLMRINQSERTAITYPDGVKYVRLWQRVGSNVS